MNDKLVVKNVDGHDQTLNVIDIVLDNETGKKYIFYTMDESEKIYASILVEKDGKYIIQAITEDTEFELVEEILKNKVALEGVTNE